MTSIPFDLSASASNLDAACQLLRQVNCLDSDVKIERAALRQALRTVTQASDYQILGVCADTLTQGLRALETYAVALQYHPNPDLAALEGAVYLKFNPISGLCYASPYSGSHRGVLVSCQSADAGINEMFGHLPLDLFIE